MKISKRLISVLLALLMCVSLFPVSAFAAEEADEPAEAVETAEPAEEAALPEEAEEPEDPADEPAEELAPQNAEEPAEDGAPEDGVEVCDVSTDMRLVNATGEFDGYDPYPEDHEYYYEYYVEVEQGEEVSLRVQVAGAVGEVSYRWYDNDDNDIEDADGPELPAFTPDFTDASYSCAIVDESGTYIGVEFYIQVVPPQPRLLPHFGTTSYKTAPGIPVTLQVDLPEEYSTGSASGYWCVINEKDNEIKPPFASSMSTVVSPSVSTKYFAFFYSYNPYVSFEPAVFSVEVTPDAYPVLEQDYLTLSPGNEYILKTPDFPEYWSVDTEWTDEDQVPSLANETGEVIRVTDHGNMCSIRAVGEGSAFATLVLYTIDNDGSRAEYTKLRCRVDVTEGAIADAVVTDNYEYGVTLPAPAATVNVYSTDYTRFEVLVDLENNQIGAQGLLDGLFPPESPLMNEGWAVNAAWFTDEAAGEAFSLRVVDDRTLEIIPNIDFSAANYADAVKAVKGSYKSTVTVVLRDIGPVETDKPLSLTVKKTLPKVKASAVKFNSFIAGDVQELRISPEFLSVRPDPSKAQPDWVKVDGEPDGQGDTWLNSMNLTYTGERNKSLSGKLYLLVKPEGCAVEIPVTATVKAAKTAPKLKVKGTLNINPNSQRSAWTTVTVKPAQFMGNEIRITKITEGKKVWSAVDGTLPDAPISCRIELENQYYLDVWASDALDTSKAHTFKVTLDMDGATAVATVKTAVKSTKVTVKMKLKMSGTIDTMIRGSAATVTWNVTGMPSAYGMSPRFRVEQYQGKKVVNDDVTDLFSFSQCNYNQSRVTIEEGATVPKGYTYYLIGEFKPLRASEPVATAKVKLPVKWPDTRAKITATLKASGAIDLVRPGTSVTITLGPLKNCYTYSANPSNLYISRDKTGADPIPLTSPESPFSFVPISSMPGGGMRISLMLSENYRDEVKPTEKFYIFVWIPEGNENTDGQEVRTKPVQIKLTKSTPKITQTVKSVQLLKNDRFSYADIGVVVPDGYTDIREVTLDAKSAARFTLTDNGAGNVELHLRQDNPVTKNATVKLNVFLEGNNTAKPDKVLSVKVKFA